MGAGGVGVGKCLSRSPIKRRERQRKVTNFRDHYPQGTPVFNHPRAEQENLQYCRDTDQDPKKPCVFLSLTSSLPAKTAALDLIFFRQPNQYWILCARAFVRPHEGKEKLSQLQGKGLVVNHLTKREGPYCRWSRQEALAQHVR